MEWNGECDLVGNEEWKKYSWEKYSWEAWEIEIEEFFPMRAGLITLILI